MTISSTVVRQLTAGDGSTTNFTYPFKIFADSDLSVKENIPFLNLFYLKTAFDYAIGYQIMETLSPGSLKRMEKNMAKSGQEFLLTKPSTLFKGF